MRFALLGCASLGGCDCANEPCFEGEATFGEIQTQIFDRSCNFSSVCHNDNPGPSVGDLGLCGPESPSTWCDNETSSPYDRLVGVQASCEYDPDDCPDPDCVPDDENRPIRVVPGDPAASYLYRRVLGEGLAPCVRRMPWGPNRLCKEGVDAIRTWIESGAEP